MPCQTLIATALLVGISMLAMAAVVEFYSEDVRQYCVGPYCIIGYAYQKTWTKVGYDDSARKVVSHTGAARIDSKGLYGYVVKAQGHPYIAGCIGDPWSGYGWMRIDYDTVDWYFLGIYAITWHTQSSIEVYAC
ncbi:MAG: hypothetical protein LM566_00015 [Pyrobaculum sp.]|nr:hypothetical protein [Pyrobaculum sp.]